MRFKLRKLFIWLVSLVVALSVYLLIGRVGKTPQIQIGTNAETDLDSNVGGFDSEIGMVGEVGVGTVEMARFTDYKDEKLVGEFGFEKLLHKQGDEWEIERPYRNIFRRNFKCYITAEKGMVQVETVANKTRPKDATLSGNVVIHILPERDSDIKESFIYLDDVTYISEKSQFLTAGPVKFVSENTRMLGTGLELVYNDRTGRLEFLRVIHLQSLNLKTVKTNLLLSSQTNPAAAVNTDSQASIPLPPEPIAADVPQKPEPKPKTLATSSPQVIEKSKGENYKCTFSKNVIIDTPEYLAFAGNELSINNIFWSKASGEKSTRVDTLGENNAKADNVPVAELTEPDEPGVHKLQKTHFAENDETATHLETQPDEQLVDIVVTCENGFVVMPMDSPAVYQNSAWLDPETVSDGKGAKSFGDIHSRRKYTISAPKIAVDLSKDRDPVLKKNRKMRTRIEHLRASGGVVQLSIVKKTEEKLLGFTKLKARKFDYSPEQQLFLATGPGLIAVDNSSISEPVTEPGRFSLKKPCYAVVQNFDTLKYSLETNQIIANSQNERIFIDYFPVVDGRYAEQVSATAGHIVAELIETPEGQTELSALHAAGGITYEEIPGESKKKRRKDKAVQFSGSEFFYDADKSLITAWGDELQQCLLNDVLVKGIEHNLKTGKTKIKIVGPGTY